MIKSFKSDDGSYSIEASISLVAFLIAIMFVYSQVKVLICESIMQSAVNNMAKETASYVYIIDRMGLVYQHTEDELDKFNNVYGGVVNVSENADKLSDDFVGLLDGLFSDGDNSGKVTTVMNGSQQIQGDASNMVDSIKNLLNMVKGIDKEDLKQLGGYSADQLVKGLGNSVMSGYYEWKLSAYLPMDKDQFCKYYMIDPDSITFESSRIMPNNDYTILVCVEYDTSSTLKMFPVKRHVVKYAYTAAWCKFNSNTTYGKTMGA